MKRSKTFTITFNYFEPGTYVTPTSRRCVLEPGTIHKVIECHEPLFPGEDAIVFVEGKRTGLSTEYLREAKAEEIAAGSCKVEW